MWPRRNKIAGRSSYGRPSKGHRGRRSGAGYGRNRAEAADADPGREGKRQAGRRAGAGSPNHRRPGGTSWRAGLSAIACASA